jgi:RecA/RadA recombinase
MIKIIGDAPRINRLVTNLYSFDKAFANNRGDIGIPLGVAVEIAGSPGVGKSTTAYSLSGMIANHVKSDIALADVEGFDPGNLEMILDHTGFKGNVLLIQKETDEKTLDGLIDVLKDPTSKSKKDTSNEFAGLYTFVAILDSVGGLSPISEIEGELGEANMGKRAKLLGQFSRKALHLLRNNPKSLFIINHIHPNFGYPGTSTPGGETLKYLEAIRIKIKRKEEFPDQSYILEGTLSKNRHGYINRKFYLFMLAGHGIHIGLTAMYDCFLLGLAERGKVVKIDGNSFGYLKDLVEDAHEGNNDKFVPFLDLLRTYSGVIENGSTDSNETADDSNETE